VPVGGARRKRLDKAESHAIDLFLEGCFDILLCLLIIGGGVDGASRAVADTLDCGEKLSHMDRVSHFGGSACGRRSGYLPHERGGCQLSACSAVSSVIVHEHGDLLGPARSVDQGTGPDGDSVAIALNGEDEGPASQGAFNSGCHIRRPSVRGGYGVNRNDHEHPPGAAYPGYANGLTLQVHLRQYLGNDSLHQRMVATGALLGSRGMPYPEWGRPGDPFFFDYCGQIGTSRLACLSFLVNFVNLNGEVGAHPAANSAGIALFGVRKRRQNISVYIESVSRDGYAAAGAEMLAVPASAAVLFIYDDLSLKLSQRDPLSGIVVYPL